MKPVRLRSGGEVFILESGEVCPVGSVCFQQDELDHARRVSAGLSQDVEGNRSFWAMIIEKKEADPSYSLFTDFPKNEGLKICAEILEMLRRGKRKDESA